MSLLRDPRVLITLAGSFAATYKSIEHFHVAPDSIWMPLMMTGYAAIIYVIMWAIGMFVGNRFK
jgi:hypothetical protein